MGMYGITDARTTPTISLRPGRGIKRKYLDPCRIGDHQMLNRPCAPARVFVGQVKYTRKLLGSCYQ